MSLNQSISNLAVRIGQEFNLFNSQLGDLSNLNTNDKDNIVNAINNLSTLLSELETLANSKTSIDDSLENSVNTTYSIDKIKSEIESSITDLKNTLNTFTPTIANESLLMPEEVGGQKIASVGDLKNKSYDELLTNLYFPDKDAYISLFNNVVAHGIPEVIDEVGTSYIPSINVVYTNGTISNGDDTPAGDLTGNLSSVEYLLDDVILATDTSPSSTFSSQVLPAKIIEKGENKWKVRAYYLEGNTNYVNNKGSLQLVDEVEAAKVAGYVEDYTSSITGRYYAWNYLGNKDTSPSTSVDVRSITNKLFLDENENIEYDLYIPEGTEEVSFYIPAGKSISVIDKGNLNVDLTQSFERLTFNVNDANGQPILYERNKIFLGLGGYLNSTNFNIIVS